MPWQRLQWVVETFLSQLSTLLKQLFQVSFLLFTIDEYLIWYICWKMTDLFLSLWLLFDWVIFVCSHLITFDWVARLGSNVQIGLLLATVGFLKFGFGASIATFWAAFWITGDCFGVEIADFGLLFASVWRRDSRKIWRLWLELCDEHSVVLKK